jgi:phosphoribosylaminoimidazole (AIR) synthetase
LGIGMIVVCSPEIRDELAHELERAGETVIGLGDIVAGERGVEWVG